MADVNINFRNVSLPPMPPGVQEFYRNGWIGTSRGLECPATGTSEVKYGYIKFDAEVGTVTGYAAVSSETNYDYMMLHVSQSNTPPSRNNGNMLNISGSQLGKVATYKITTAGVWYLHFAYGKDSSGSSGEDRGWLEQVTLPLKSGNGDSVRVNGAWYDGEKYVRVNGAWYSGITNVRANGAWYSINGLESGQSTPQIEPYKYSYGPGGYVNVESTPNGKVVKTKGVGANFARPHIVISGLKQGDVVRIECVYRRCSASYYIDWEDDTKMLTQITGSSGTYAYNRTVETGKTSIRFGCVVAGTTSHWCEVDMNSITVNGVRI